MTRALHRTNGFAIIELALVLIVIGILAAVFVPMAQVSHEDAMRTRDMDSLESAQNALMGYIRVNEGIPCVNTGGVQVTTNCDPTRTLELLGVRTTDSRGRTFAFDVNETLTVAGIDASGTPLCTALTNMISPPPLPATPPPLDPQVCESANDETGDTACTAGSSMAFVLVGRGSDRCLNLENAHASADNDAVCPAAVAANRTFENPARLHSRTTDDGYYDDLIFTLTPFELAEALECPAGGGSGGFTYCPPGEKLVQIINGNNQNKCIDVTPRQYEVQARSSGNIGCQPEATLLAVRNPGCSNSAILSDSLASLDDNNDGRVDILCDDNGLCTAR